MGAVAQSVLDASLRQAVNLAGWENGLVRRLIGVLDQADLELEARISRGVEEGRAPQAIRRLRDLRVELQRLNRDAYRTVGQELTGELGDFATRLAPAQAGILERSIPFAWSFTRPSEQLLRSIITSEPFQGDLLRPHIDKLAGNRQAALMAAIEQGLVQGDSLSEILIRVRGRRRGNRFAGGILDAHQVGRPALEGLIRTATQHVQTRALGSLYEANADLVAGAMWVATLDHRTCKICQPRDGLVWDYDPETGAYTPRGHDIAWLNGPGRAHWRCRCVPIAVLRSLAAFERAGLDVRKLTKGERAAMGGPVPATENYETWLRRQPAEIQDIALGSRQRADAFRAGVDLGEAWGRSFRFGVVRAQRLDAILPRVPAPATENPVAIATLRG